MSVSGQQEFERHVDVSRETLEKMNSYHRLLLKWNSSINLISGNLTDDMVWRRHFLDSAQILGLVATKMGHWVDIGSGGGFPGLVVATLATEKAPDLKFTLIESDVRKATFLRTVARELGIPAEVIVNRAEKQPSLAADVLSARALAPLSRLLPYAERHLRAGGEALFMKGARYRQEIEEALENWRFRIHEYPSITHGEAVILKLGDIRRV